MRLSCRQTPPGQSLGAVHASPLLPPPKHTVGVSSSVHLWLPRGEPPGQLLSLAPLSSISQLAAPPVMALMALHTSQSTILPTQVANAAWSGAVAQSPSSAPGGGLIGASMSSTHLPAMSSASFCCLL